MPRHDIFTYSSFFTRAVGKTKKQKLWNIKLLQTTTNSIRFFILQNFPTCSLNLQSFQSLPKICSTWSLWCKENETQEGDTAGNYNSNNCDQSTSRSSTNLVRTPPKLPRHHRKLKMPFRRRNWCGCIQVRVMRLIAFRWHFFFREHWLTGFGASHITLQHNLVEKKRKKNYEMPNFSINFVARNVCSFILFCNWERKREVCEWTGESHSKHTRHLIFECKKWFFFRFLPR